MALQIIDICLSDIPAANRTTAKNGKVYAKFAVADRKEPDQYGNTLTVYMNQTKEQREQQVPKVYVGSGKQVAGGFNQAQQQAAPGPDRPHASPAAPVSAPPPGDLPF